MMTSPLSLSLSLSLSFSPWLLLLLLLLFRYNILCSVLKAFSGPTDVCAFHHLVQSEKIRALKGKNILANTFLVVRNHFALIGAIRRTEFQINHTSVSNRNLIKRRVR